MHHNIYQSTQLTVIANRSQEFEIHKSVQARNGYAHFQIKWANKLEPEEMKQNGSLPHIKGVTDKISVTLKKTERQTYIHCKQESCQHQCIS